LGRYHQGLSREWPIYSVLSSKEWNLKRSILLLAQEVTPSIRTKTKPFHNPKLCACAFTIGKKLVVLWFISRQKKSLAILSSFTTTCQQFGINLWTYLRDTLTKLPITSADQLHTLMPIK